jgi:hypothetical protein
MASFAKLNQQLEAVVNSIDNLQVEINKLRIEYSEGIAAGLKDNGTSLKLAALDQQLTATYETQENLIQQLEIEKLRMGSKEYKADMARAEKLGIDAAALAAKAKADALAILQALDLVTGMENERITLLKKCDPDIPKSALIKRDVVLEILRGSLAAYARDARFVEGARAISRQMIGKR